METRGVVHMKNRPKGIKVIIFLAVALFFPNAGLAIEVEALKDMLDQGEKVTIIDIRSQELFVEGHIRSAINIPAAIIGRKPLPPLGKVVVCGDGIRRDITLKAVETLNTREGIQAELLEGGFAAWQGLSFPSTRNPGVKMVQFRYITYADLKKALAGNGDMVLVDIRHLRNRKRQAGKDKQKADEEDLSDLSEKFPGIEIIIPECNIFRSGTEGPDISIAAFSGSERNGQKQVFVLVDSGDGKAEKVARRLHSAGIRQVAILIGGEKILQRKGQSGSQTQVSGDSL